MAKKKCPTGVSSYLSDKVTHTDVRVPQDRFGVDGEVKKSSIRGIINDLD